MAGRTERGQGELQGSQRAATSLSLAGHSLGAARPAPGAASAGDQVRKVSEVSLDVDA